MNDATAGETTPLLSIIIPTRERCEYLVSCVRSALACSDSEIEIVVSDNASSDDTRAVVKSFDDARLVYANPGTRVPMHDNFEFALSKSRGRHVMFIGDDDAVLPERIRRLLVLLRDKRPQIVNWHPPNYVWPGGANGDHGLLTLKPLHLRGGQSKRDARERLCSLADGSRESYRFGGAKIYHGCVDRKVITQVIARAGRYFFVPWPDVGAAIANLFVADTILVLGQPCTLGGESRASNGWAQRFQESQHDRDNPHVAFVQENLTRTGSGAVDSRIRPIAALTFFTLAEALRRMGGEKPPRLNTRAWIPMLESELASVPEPARSEQADIVDASLASIGVAPLDRNWSSKGKHKSARLRPPVRRHRLLPDRMGIVSRPGLCGNVFDAALLTDRILGSASDAERRGNIALAGAWMGALRRAAGIVGSRAKTVQVFGDHVAVAHNSFPHRAGK